MTTHERIKRYLVKKNDWVERNEIYALCKSVGIKWEDTKIALQILEDDMEIGVQSYRDLNANYVNLVRWYKLTDKEREQQSRQRELWESLA